ncbi:GntR family transcriptional regulator [Kiloniella spongiae]|uniref:GntR family transcriptional regulator n=1 Tax=Kiloniella spongiae TaxID=1489064 RepID=A0A0H2MB61_9PROT|nr:phosphonate metabolism transcriptional regulator PhnF [Kiloniella spongiae]KLN59794.1 GntR family transcriptional regulator [Kiloniella spongiae]
MEWEKGEAIWKQIGRHLLQDITAGVYKPGDKLPTENELAKRFGVNRHTVRSAIAALTEDNVMRVEQGRGTFVQENLMDYTLGSRTRFSQIVSGRHRLPDKTLLSSEREKATRQVAKRLMVAIDEKVIKLEAVSHADGVALAHSISYLPALRFKGIEKVFAETKSLTEAFKHFGLNDYTRKNTRITAQMPSKRTAELLQQAKNKPVLITESVDVDATGKAIQFGITHFASERVQLFVDNESVNPLS